MPVFADMKTDPELLKLLKAVAKHVMTPEEIFEQKVSFVYGQLMDCAPNVTKEEVRRAIRKVGRENGK